MILAAEKRGKLTLSAKVVSSIFHFNWISSKIRISMGAPPFES